MAETGCRACPSLVIRQWNQSELTVTQVGLSLIILANGWQEHAFTHKESDNPRGLISEDTQVYILSVSDPRILLPR